MVGEEVLKGFRPPLNGAIHRDEDASTLQSLSAWLSEALAAERHAVGQELERRHLDIVDDLAWHLGRGHGDVGGPVTLLHDLVPQPPKLAELPMLLSPTAAGGPHLKVAEHPFSLPGVFDLGTWEAPKIPGSPVMPVRDGPNVRQGVGRTAPADEENAWDNLSSSSGSLSEAGLASQHLAELVASHQLNERHSGGGPSRSSRPQVGPQATIQSVIELDQKLDIEGRALQRRWFSKMYSESTQAVANAPHGLPAAVNVIKEEESERRESVTASTAFGVDLTFGTSGAKLQRIQKVKKKGPKRTSTLNLSDTVMLHHHHWLQRLHPTVLTRDPWFETVFVMLIVLNTVFIAVELQYHGIQRGHELGYPKFTNTAEEAWPGARQVFDISEVFFGICFTLEISIKLAGLRRKFIWDWWNWFDFGIVLFWLVEQIAKGLIEFDPLLLRIARLVRLLRLLRLVRTIQGFDSLYLMTTAMRGSLLVLLWSAILLFIVQLLVALLLNNVLEAYIRDDKNAATHRLQVFEYFGTSSRATLTMFEITLGNWPPVARLLQENVSEWYMLFSVVHKLTIGFAVIGVINGVFMQETFKVAASDDKIMMRQKERAQRVHTRKMEALFQLADKDGSGMLDCSEFKEVVGDPAVKTWLGAQELDASDADTLFKLLDNGDGHLTALELVQGVARLKGPARSIDLASLMHDHNKTRELVISLCQKLLAESAHSHHGCHACHHHHHSDGGKRRSSRGSREPGEQKQK